MTSIFQIPIPGHCRVCGADHDSDEVAAACAEGDEVRLASGWKVVDTGVLESPEGLRLRVLPDPTGNDT